MPPRIMRTRITVMGLDRFFSFKLLGAVTLGALMGGTACGSDSNKPTSGAGGDGAEQSGGETGHAGQTGTKAGSGGSDGGDGTGDGGGGQAGIVGSGGNGGASDGPVEPGETTEKPIGAAGGEIIVTNADGEVTTSLTVPQGALAEDTDVTIAPAALPESAPGSVESLGTGISVDFGGKTLTVPAKAKLRVAFDPADGDLVILVITDSGTGVVKYTLETEGDDTYAVFDVVEGGRYVPVRLKHVAGCDETLPQAPQLASQADVDKLSKVRRIVGDLRISGATITSLASLKCLQQIDGALIVTGTGVHDFQGLEGLTFVGANATYYYGYYGVQLTSNSLLESASLPSVMSVGTRQTNYYYQSVFQVQSNPVLASFSADAIESAGLLFQSNGAAATETNISMAALSKAQSFNVSQNPSLKNLDGFGALDTVVGDFTISTNGLTNLDGLKSLGRTGALSVQSNVALTSATGFSKIQQVGSISINGNLLLKSVNFAALTAVDQQTQTSESILVQNNAGLNDFKADKLASLGGALTFQQNGNAAVDTVLSMAALKTVGGAVTISNNLGTQSLDGLKALTATGDLTLNSNASLKSTAGLGSLASVGTLTISQNAKLTDVEGLTKLTSIGEAVNISSNAALKTIALPAVATVGQGVVIQSNAVLTSMSMDALKVAPASITFQQNGVAGGTTTLSFAALSSVAQQLYIYSNPGLKALDGLGALLSVGTNLTIQSNGVLANLASLSKLSTISGSLNISSNALLANLDGLAALSRVTGGITLSSNAALADITLPALTTAGGISITSNAGLSNVELDALAASSAAFAFSSNGTANTVTTTTLSFAALATIAQGFTLNSNPKLKALTGFPGLSGVGGAFYVYGNVLLPNCSIVALRNQIQQKGAISGSITISSNLVDGCATT